jgi:hypothetical protein
MPQSEAGKSMKRGLFFLTFQTLPGGGTPSHAWWVSLRWAAFACLLAAGAGVSHAQTNCHRTNALALVAAPPPQDDGGVPPRCITALGLLPEEAAAAAPTPAISPAAFEVMSYFVGKGQLRQQTTSGSATLVSNVSPYRFLSFVEAAGGSVRQASVTPPGATSARALSNTLERFEYQRGHSNRPALDAAFSNGTYRLSITTSNQVIRRPLLNLTGDAYPSAPHVANWGDAQNLEAGLDFTLFWDRWSNGTTSDFVHLVIENGGGTVVFKTGAFLDGAALNGTHTSALIPNGTLQPDQAYRGRLLFLRPVHRNATNYPGAIGVAAYYAETLFPIATAAAAPAGGRLQFTSSFYSGSETGGVVSFMIVRAGSAVGALTAQLWTTPGTASEGTDYEPINRLLEFADQEMAKTVALRLVNDFALEGTETVQLSLALLSEGAELGNPSNAVVRILDDEVRAAGTFAFSSAQYSVNETSGTARITIVRTNGSSGAVTVEAATGGGTATAGFDYQGRTNVLAFAAGVTNRNWTIPVYDDNRDDPNKTIRLHLRNPTGGASLGAGTNATLALLDNDRGGILRFSSTNFTAGENQTNALITVVRTDGAAAGVAVSYATRDFTASNAVDYLFSEGVLEFGAGVSSRSFLVGLVDNDHPDSARAVRLELSDPVGGATLGLSNALLSITDDENTLQFTSATNRVTEAVGTALLSVARSGPTNRAVAVQYFTKDGTAVSNLDYKPKRGTLSFAPGVRRRDISVVITNDAIVETNESFSVCLENVTGEGAFLGARTTTEVAITDDDFGGAFAFGAAAYSFFESNRFAIVNLRRSGGMAGGVSVRVETEDGSAQAGTDYVSLSTTLEFAAGETSRPVSIRLYDDAVVETNRTFVLHLSDATGGARIGAVSNTTVTIRNDDFPGTILFSAATYSFTESGSQVQLTVLRTNGNSAGVSVNFSVVGGTATNPADYTVVTASPLTFGSNQTSRKITLQLVNDTVVEPVETIRFRLSAPTGGATLGAISNTTVSLVDNDVDVDGTYKVTATIRIQECADPSDNGLFNATGEIQLHHDNSNAFSGNGVLLFSGGGGYLTLNLVGTASPSGAISGSYDGNSESVEGTFTGRVTNGTLQLRLIGTTVTCSHTGSISGPLYAPPAGGAAPTAITDRSATLQITGGTGVFGASGRARVEFDAFGDFTYVLIPLSGNVGSSMGGYEYSKTAPNIGTLKIYDSSLEDIAIFTLDFSTGIYTAVAQSSAGTQLGTFTLQ